jgi:hypothetical protein
MFNFFKPNKEAQTAFDQVSFKNGTIDDLHLKTLGVYDAKIDWYANAAERRRFFSVVIRWAAIISGGIGAIILELVAYDTQTASTQITLAEAVLKKLMLDSHGAPPSAISTMLFVIAGLILLTDRVLLVNRNFVQYRVVQFKIESLRADFHASYIETYAKGFNTDPSILFNQLHTLCAKSLSALADEVENETKAWQTSFNEGLTLLSKRLEKDLPTAKALVKKAQEDAQKEAVAAQPATLDVKVKLMNTQNKNRDGEFAIHVDGATPNEAAVGPGETRSFFLPPGMHTVILTTNGKVIESKSVKLMANIVNPTLEI